MPFEVGAAFAWLTQQFNMSETEAMRLIESVGEPYWSAREGRFQVECHGQRRESTAIPTPQRPPPLVAVDYDQLFIENLEADAAVLGVDDAIAFDADGHVADPTHVIGAAQAVCMELMAGVPLVEIVRRLVEGATTRVTHMQAQMFAHTAMVTYPNCP